MKGEKWSGKKRRTALSAPSRAGSDEDGTKTRGLNRKSNQTVEEANWVASILGFFTKGERPVARKMQCQ